jgi:hypothetical protein
MNAKDVLHDPTAAPLLGQGSVHRVTTTGSVTGIHAYAVVCHNDTVFATLSENDATGSLVGITVPAQTVLYGKFTAFAVSSGSPEILVSVHLV